MKYKLNVSYDAGTSYRIEQESDNLEELKKVGKKFDEQKLRWDIEDEKGKQLECCAIHKAIISFLGTANEKELDIVRKEKLPKSVA